MRLSLLLIALCAGFASSAAAQVPQMLQVQPGKGTIGSVLRVSGTSLDKAKVDEVYLTDHTFDMKVKVLEQSGDIIRFRIPPSVKPGRLQLLVKTAGKNAMLLEQPVFITIEEEQPKENTEVAASSR
jgi:hypothetical protein